MPVLLYSTSFKMAPRYRIKRDGAVTDGAIGDLGSFAMLVLNMQWVGSFRGPYFISKFRSNRRSVERTVTKRRASNFRDPIPNKKESDIWKCLSVHVHFFYNDSDACGVPWASTKLQNKTNVLIHRHRATIPSDKRINSILMITHEA